MSLPWFRLYSEDLRRPPLATMPLADRWAFVQLLGIANDEDERGLLPPTGDIAYLMRMSEGKVISLLHRLLQLTLVEQDNEARRFAIVDRARYFPKGDDSRERVRRYRSKSAGGNGAGNGDGNALQHSLRHALEEEGEENAPFGRSDGDGDGERYADSDVPSSSARSEAEAEETALARIRRRLRDEGIASMDDELRLMLEASDVECVEHCIDEAVRHNKLSLAYVESIRRRHVDEGCSEPGTTRRERLMESSRPASVGDVLQARRSR